MGRTTKDVEGAFIHREKMPPPSHGLCSLETARFHRMGTSRWQILSACLAFGKTTEFLEKFGRKELKFVLDGRIQTGSYTNKDGQRVYDGRYCRNVEFAESKNSSGRWKQLWIGTIRKTCAKQKQQVTVS